MFIINSYETTYMYSADDNLLFAETINKLKSANYNNYLVKVFRLYFWSLRLKC